MLKLQRFFTKSVECQTDCTWLTRDNPVVCTTGSQTHLVGRKLQVQKPTQTEPLTSSTKPTKQAAQAPKRTTPTDRIKKAEKPTIPLKNQYQTLNDVEMQETADSHNSSRSPKDRGGGRSRSPKDRGRGRSPVHPH